MMKDLEALLKQVLPEHIAEKKQPTCDLPEGFYLNKDRSVYIVENKEKISIDKYCDLPEILKLYCQISKEDVSKLIFIDTETTGLAGGAGTIPFLIGIGYVQEDEFIIRQYFLKNPDGEESLLHDLIRYLKSHNSLVSYNGKSFDIPLIQARLIMNQIDFSLLKYKQIDLLHIVRRLWKYRLKDCSLNTVEKTILQMLRNEILDINGAEIPQEYFYYLETGDTSTISRILYHNKQDVFSLYLLLKKVVVYLNTARDLTDENSIYSIAKWHEDLDLPKEATFYYQKISSMHPLGRKALSFLYKRDRDWEKAIELWTTAVQMEEEYAFIELAKYEEHQKKQFDKALIWTEKAIDIFQTKLLYNADEWKALQHRRKRLITKIKLSER